MVMFSFSNVEKRIVFFLILCSTTLQFALLTQGHNWGGDFSAYIMQAMSIVEGTATEYLLANELTLETSSEAIGPVTYPWGLPLLLSPLYALSGVDIYLFKFLGILFYQLFLLVLWFGFGQLLRVRERLLLVAIFAFNPYLLSFANYILSDIPFLFFSTLAMVLINRLIGQTDLCNIWNGFTTRLESESTRNMRGSLVWIYSVAMGLAVSAAVLTRSNGILLIAVLVSVCVLTRQFKLLIISLLSCLALNTLIAASLPDAQSSYAEQLGGITANTLLDNLHYYAVLLQDFFAPAGRLRWAGLLIYLFSLPLVVLGMMAYWQRSWPYLGYMLLTIGLFVVWPFQQGLRFWFPLLPFYVLYGILGLRQAGERLGLNCIRSLSHSVKLSQSVAFTPLIALTLIFFIASSYMAIRNIARDRPAPEGPYTIMATEMFNFIQQHSELDDVIVFRKPRVMRLMTGRDTVMLRTLNESNRGDYIVIDRKNAGDQPDIGYGVQSQSVVGLVPSLRLVFSNEQFEVYSRMMVSNIQD